ncbi:YhgE/Pip domain-containing protein [Corynebacterium sp. Marseille-P3884]|uniref:YhgE/Pip domain-containing protein n=1 Tax=Corynebacterium sp. Marseille-P3884 TaxID=2495409 RepID=UPI001B339530|nr:YhgE/Pip domain-containing protein [Corynebacterium sp. Marseille-P3884]MBP3949055.1 YhgE/Pip domain-containing protein [Corynebacterium sp. Marseille-P3884]
MSTKVTGGDADTPRTERGGRVLRPLERLLMWRPFSTVARTIIILALVFPLLFAGLFMWAMWDPTGSVPHTKLAVVNNDKGVDRGEGAGLEEFGADVVEGLTSRDYLDFDVVNSEDAKKGLMTGKYLFTVTIPEDFSKNVVTVIDPEPKQASIMVDFNDYNGSNGAILTAGLVPQIQSEVRAEVAKTYAEEVLGGINELGDGIRAAADGSKQLDDGVGELKDGGKKAVDGINKLDDGANELHDGTGRLVDGTGELTDGVGELSDGAGRLDDGAKQLNDGLYQLEDGTDQLADGARQIDEGVDKLTGMLIPLLENVQGGVGQLKPIVDTLRQFGLHAEADKLDGIVSQLDPENPENVVNDLNRLRDGTGELYANLSDPEMPYRNGLDRLIDGSDQLVDGTGQLTDGVSRLEDGANQLDDGARQLNDGTSRLTDGTQQLVDGGGQLEDGMNRLKDGSEELSTKLDEGAGRAPKVKAMDKSSEQIAVPIIFDEANLHPTQVVVDPADPTKKEPSSGFSILGLIVINFLLMAVVSILLPHAIGRRHKASGAAGPVLSAWARMLGINVALTALLGFVSITLGWRPENWFIIGAALLLIDVAGTTIFQFFRVLFGRVVGAMFNIGFFALGLFVSSAVWPLSTLPAPLAFMNPLHPMSHARNLFVRSVDGIYDGTFWIAIVVLLVFTALALGASIVIYDARRNALFIDDPNENERERAKYEREIREGEEPLQSVFSR